MHEDEPTDGTGPTTVEQPVPGQQVAAYDAAPELLE